MPRVLLIHWNTDEAEKLARPLRDAGFAVTCYSDLKGGIPGLRTIRENPLDVFVISLERLPSAGSGIATWLRQQKATRGIPLIFAGGKPDKVDNVRKVLPDAVFTGWDKVAGAVRHADVAAPVEPVVPGTMQSYTGTPLPKKLGVKPGATVMLLGAPAGFEKSLDPLPEGTAIRRQARGTAGLILLFATSSGELARRFPAAVKALDKPGRLWIIWPKRASGVDTDLSGNEVRRFGMDRGLVDFKIAAIDATWSGLAFARRKE